MSEILSLQVGQCGNQLGTKFWEAINYEHGIDTLGNYVGEREEQLECSSAYYTEGMGQHYLPRALLVDLEPGVADSIRASSIGKMFKLENYVLGQTGAGNNWAKGFYTEGAELVDSVLDMARLEIENCDSYQGAQIIHSISGGTGAGLGTLLLSKLRQEYPDRILKTLSVLSNPGTTDSIASPYNALLSLHQMTENADTCVMFDNRALYNLFFRGFSRYLIPNYGDLNRLLSRAISGVTCPLRFRTEANGTMRAMAQNLVPYPRSHFLMVSHTPLGELHDEVARPQNFTELTEVMLQQRNLMCDTDLRYGKCMAGVAIYQGKNSKKEVSIDILVDNRDRSFLRWVGTSDAIKISTCEIPPIGRRWSGTFLSNSTSIQRVFQSTHDQFTAIFRRKAFLHWYLGQGMDQMEFTEAGANLQDLIDEYQARESVTQEDQMNHDI